MTDHIKLEFSVEISDSPDFEKTSPLIQWAKWLSSSQTKISAGMVKVNQNSSETEPLAEFSSVLGIVLQNVSGHRNAVTLQGSFNGSTESFRMPPGAISIWPRDASQVSFTAVNTGNFTSGLIEFVAFGT